jgi:hypothetical protein
MIGLELLESSEGFVAYVLVFLLAAIPWIEILLVIPVGIAIDLNPLTVAVLAATGNLATVYLLVFAHGSLHSFWQKLRLNDNGKRPEGRKKKAIHTWDSYGLPGLSMLAPVVTGTHLAALIALGLGSRRYSVALWLTLSILIWTAVVTATSYYGIESLKWLLG